MEHSPEVTEQTRWIVGLLLSTPIVGSAFMWVRRVIRRNRDIETMTDSVKAHSEQLVDHDSRITKQQADIDVLKVHVDNGSRERAEIKRMINTMDVKLDRVVDHLIPDK